MLRKIIWVDSDSWVRLISNGVWDRLGVETEIFENGVPALQRLLALMNQSVPVGAVILNVQLPDISGFKLSKIIKYKYPGLPVLLLTGTADRIDLEAIQSLKVQGWLKKPFSVEELVGQLESVLGIRSGNLGEGSTVSPESLVALLKIQEGSDFADLLQKLQKIDRVVSCEAIKGEFSLLVRMEGKELSQDQDGLDRQFRKLKGIQEILLLPIGQPVLDEGAQSVIQAAEAAFSEDPVTETQKCGPVKHLSSYVLVDILLSQVSQDFIILKLADPVTRCDYIPGRSSFLVRIEGDNFSSIDQFVEHRIVPLNGVTKVKEYPVVDLL